MPLTADRNTPYMDGQEFPVPVAADAVIFAGAHVCANAAGFAVPGAVAATLVALGRAEEKVDNTGGANGAKTVRVRSRRAFYWKNSALDAVTQASLGRTCYIEDDQTVSATSDSNARSAAGIVIGVDAGGVWVLNKL